jgi:hypothetical protein
MIDYELIEALAAKLREYTTAPLSTCEVHEWDQIGLEGANGGVVVSCAEGGQGHIAIGEHLMDRCPLIIHGEIVHADTQASRRNISLLRSQIVSVLRSNRTLTAGGENARTNAAERITWRYGVFADPHVVRWCEVYVTYEYEPDAAT